MTVTMKHTIYQTFPSKEKYLGYSMASYQVYDFTNIRVHRNNMVYLIAFYFIIYYLASEYKISNGSKPANIAAKIDFDSNFSTGEFIGRYHELKKVVDLLNHEIPVILLSADS